MLRLNRTVHADGVPYPPGTPLSALPPCNQESVRLNGWATEASGSEPEPASQPEPVVDPVPTPEGDEAEPPSVPEDPAPSEPEPIVVAEPDPEPVAMTSLDSIEGLSREHLELLTIQGIHTLEQARDYLAANKSFRPLRGIGRAGDEQIRQALGL